MADDTTFNADFALWYKTLSLGAEPATLERRRAGTAALVDNLPLTDVDALVRVAFKSRQVAANEALARIRKPFKASDDGFAMQGNERELQLLCGAALAELFRRDGQVSATAALAVSTAAAGGMRRPDLPLDLAEAAEASITAQSVATRKRPDLARIPAPPFPKAEFDKAGAKLQPQQDFPTVIASLAILTEASAAAHAAIWKGCAGGLAAANSYIEIQDEELDMLWWLIGERSVVLDRPFREVPLGERTFVLAKELADMTLAAPGPHAVKSLLSRASVKEQDKVTIPECVNACDTDWLRTLVEGTNPSPVTRPLHLAIKRKIETGDSDSWVQAWAATTDLDATQKVSALAVAVLFYRERLIARSRIGE